MVRSFKECVAILVATTAVCAWHSTGMAEPFRIVHAFADGSGAATPYSSPILHDGWLIGTTSFTSNDSTSTSVSGTRTRGGSIYAVRTNGSDFRILKSFTDTGAAALDGYAPFQGLTIVGDRIFGTNLSGGANGKGTLYSIGIDGSNFMVVRQFGGAGDGATPYAAPVLVGSTLFGMTFAGGTANGGTIYSYDTLSGGYQVRHSFGTLGKQPFGTLTPIDGKLYGTVSDHRNPSAYGQIFRFDPGDGSYQVLHAFAGGTNGGYPYDTLAWDGGHYVYGTTLGFYPFTPSTKPEDVAGRLDEGVVFRMNLLTNAYDVLHDFRAAAGDGAKPNSSMLIAPDGWLYGIAHGSESFGGTEWGTFYRLKPDGSDFAVLHTFDSMADGMVPMRALVWDQGTIYGTAVFGGEGGGVGNGMVWSYVTVPEPSAGVAGLIGLIIVGYGRRRGRSVQTRIAGGTACGGQQHSPAAFRKSARILVEVRDGALLPRE